MIICLNGPRMFYVLFIKKYLNNNVLEIAITRTNTKQIGDYKSGNKIISYTNAISIHQILALKTHFNDTSTPNHDDDMIYG